MCCPDFNLTLRPGFPGWCLRPQMTNFGSSAFHSLSGPQPSQADQILFRLLLSSMGREQIVIQTPGPPTPLSSYHLRTRLNKRSRVVGCPVECGKHAGGTVETPAHLSRASLTLAGSFESHHTRLSIKVSMSNSLSILSL